MSGLPRSHGRAKKLHEARTNGKPVEIKPRYYNKGEAEVVPGYQLSKVLREWIVAYLKERPRPRDSERGFPAFENHFVGPIDYISQQSGINPRRVQGICNGEFEVVPLSQADEILMAVDRQYLLGSAEIQVVPSPGWSLEKWLDYMDERGCY